MSASQMCKVIALVVGAVACMLIATLWLRDDSRLPLRVELGSPVLSCESSGRWEGARETRERSAT